MKIISIHWSINSSIAFMHNGQIINAISEERFSRLKNDSSFPMHSIKWVLSQNNLSISDIDMWVLAGKDYSAEYQLIRKYDSFSISDYIREQDLYWYPKIYDRKKVNFLDVFKDKIDTNQYPSDYWKSKIDSNLNIINPSDFRIEVLKIFGVQPEKIIAVEHHSCHIAYAYFTSKYLYKEPVMGISIDGIGDGLNATINLIDEKGNINRVYQTGLANIGRIYRYVTLILGMKPNEHEYKMMGLAPYAKDEYLESVKKVFEDYLYVEDGEFKVKNKIPDSYFYYREKLKSYRFDNIAGGIQRYVEELLVSWIQQNINIYGVKKIVLSGGVGMNIKAMGEVIKKTSLEDLYIPGNPSDETNCIGAAYFYNHKIGNVNKPIESLYLGSMPKNDPKVIEDARKKYQVIEGPSNSLIIDELSEGKVIGRCIGNMEFGARALGNRSLLARSDNPELKERINSMIKNRDFWMPFAPIILDTFSKKYLVNTKNIDSPYMTIGFDTTKEGRSALKAALHQSDKTVRAQILQKKQNPELYDFIEEYSKNTGFGCILNTSFNLHGFPIVNSQLDAYHVFENSDLDCIWIDNYLIRK
jgi:carbamoyltransferase